MLDAHRVAGRLWQGSFPPPGPFLQGRVDVLVLCARELQPHQAAYPGVRVVHAPFSDHGDPPTRGEVIIARQAAGKVRAALDVGQSVLVTCHLGLNRSGLVSALAMMLPHGPRWVVDDTPSCLRSGEAVALVRRARGDHALGNRYFVRILTKHDGLCSARPNTLRTGGLFL
jgi:protein-tyrosine phosphatase